SRPDLVRAFAAFKSPNTSNIFRPLFEGEKDLFVRAAMADVLAEQPPTRENADALRSGLDKALITDKYYNDAELAIMDALAKVAGRGSISALSLATYAPDYLVRKKAAELLNQFPGWDDTREFEGRRLKTLTVQPYDVKNTTKQGQLLNSDAD